ncbi:MAG: exodeoxyribonuclease VII large subunit [Candidatus Saccharibacteria bacterium]
MSEPLTCTVGEFVGLLNQTLEFAYPGIVITGEIANFRVSKNRWVYFDLKDDTAMVRFFGTVYQMPGPLEDGMMVAVKGVPRLHPQYGFSVTIQSVVPTGEGSIKKAAALLEAKLKLEGLFDESRKRRVPHPPKVIGLITSGESAAYRDFMKIITARWGGLEIVHVDVQVQGEPAPGQIVAAIKQLNELADGPDVLVITRGGGSAEDLQAFSTEQVTRAVAASRIPTVVAIGHEVDISLAELAADRRASTPSNAAELLVPDRGAVLAQLQTRRERLTYAASQTAQSARQELEAHADLLFRASNQVIVQAQQQLILRRQILTAYDPQAALTRGYALVRKGSQVVRAGSQLTQGDTISVQLLDADLTAEVKQVIMHTKKKQE